MSVDLTVISFIAGMVSLAVGVLAMVLSVLFYMKSNDLVLETTRTLGEIKQTTKSLEQSVATVLTRTIDYLTGGRAPSQEELKRAAITADDKVERLKADLGDSELAQRVEELGEAFNQLREEYAAKLQDVERRRVLAVPRMQAWDELVSVSSKQEYIEALSGRGWDLYLAGELDASIEYSRRALRLDPDNPYARPNLALALLSKGKKKEALAEYSRFVDQGPDAQYIWYAVKDLEEARRADVNGLEDALEMLVTAGEAAESGREEAAAEDEIPF